MNLLPYQFPRESSGLWSQLQPGSLTLLPGPMSAVQPASSLEVLQAECDAMRGYDPDYYAKQVHPIPMAPVVDRVEYILRQCRGKRVLHLGCGWPPGPLHRLLQPVAGYLVGVDIAVPARQVGLYVQCDLDASDIELPLENFDVILCAEILEHLGNPGHLLQLLRTWHCQVLITVPNCFSLVGYRHVQHGIENVHTQHVAWYSWHTLQELMTRYGYSIDEWCWYNCPPGFPPQLAEGLIMLVR